MVLVVDFMKLLNCNMLLPFSGIFTACVPFICDTIIFMIIQYYFRAETLETMHTEMLPYVHALFC